MTSAVLGDHLQQGDVHGLVSACVNFHWAKTCLAPGGLTPLPHDGWHQRQPDLHAIALLSGLQKEPIFDWIERYLETPELYQQARSLVSPAALSRAQDHLFSLCCEVDSTLAMALLDLLSFPLSDAGEVQPGVTARLPEWFRNSLSLFCLTRAEKVGHLCRALCECHGPVLLRTCSLHLRDWAPVFLLRSHESPTPRGAYHVVHYRQLAGPFASHGHAPVPQLSRLPFDDGSSDRDTAFVNESAIQAVAALMAHWVGSNDKPRVLESSIDRLRSNLGDCSGFSERSRTFSEWFTRWVTYHEIGHLVTALEVAALDQDHAARMRRARGDASESEECTDYVETDRWAMAYQSLLPELFAEMYAAEQLADEIEPGFGDFRHLLVAWFHPHLLRLDPRGDQEDLIARLPIVSDRVALDPRPREYLESWLASVEESLSKKDPAAHAAWLGKQVVRAEEETRRLLLTGSAF